jgi:hypothetical protein
LTKQQFFLKKIINLPNKRITMIKALTTSVIIIALITLTGCIGTFNYQESADMTKSAKKYPISVAVENFDDARPNIGGSGKMWLAYIPLMPYGWGYYNHPENGKFYLSIKSFQFNPTIDLANAATISLRHAKIFKKIYQIKKYSDFKPDFIFSGIIYQTRHDQKLFLYGLSVYGSILWLIGAPDAWTEDTIEIEFFMKNRLTKKTVWSYKTAKSDSRTHWFYYQGQDVKDFVPVMKLIMNDAIKDLASTLKNNPNLLNQ